ncbi:MAG TPA: heparinase II/III family protein [Planctomycetota bacterium]|nr:heparinase II/III family protein [Planctomycetota bacterium]
MRAILAVSAAVGFGLCAAAGEPGKGPARPAPEWAKNILEQDYLGYKFELPPTVKKKHPRLPYPSEKVLEWYRQNPKDQPADDPLLMYLITKDRKHLDQILAWMKTPPAGRNAGRWRPVWALDWLYDELPEDLRQAQLKKCRAANLGWPDSEVCPTQGMFMNQCGLTGMAEAIVAWEPGDDEQLKAAHRRFFKVFVPMWHVAMGPEGGGLSLPSYHYVHSLQSQIVGGLELWSSFLGEDLYRKYAWMKPFGYQPIFMTLPHMGTAPLGDSRDECGMTSGTPYKHGEVFTERYDDPYMRWFAHCLRGGQPPQRPVFKFTEYGVGHEFDPRGKALKPPGDGLAPERFFEGWGLAAMRSDWTEDATYALFKIGDINTNHTHCDSGMFYIYRHGDLALDSGCYSCGTNHGRSYSTLAIAHNVVTVYDPADKFVPNDGGQRAVCAEHYGSPTDVEDYLVKRREVYETGDMLAYEPCQEYVYAAGDVTAAYQCALSGGADPRQRTRRLETMTRTFLYIRPDYFAVFDRVVALKPELQKKWLLHASNQPKVDGDVVTIERNNVISTKPGKYQPDSLAMMIKTLKRPPPGGRPSDPEYFQYECHGKLFCKTLLPREHRIELVGGPGKEYWVDGKNYDMVWKVGSSGQIPLDGDPTLARGVGAWRAEVSPRGNGNNEDLFLHVIQVGDSKTLARMAPVEYLEKDGQVGFRLTANGGVYTVLFDKTDGVGGHIAFEKDGKKTIDRDFAEKILPNREPAAANDAAKP